jgi:membrane protein
MESFFLQPMLRRMFRPITRASQQVILPGLNGVSLYEVGKVFWVELISDKLQVRTAAVTYNFLMALPPTLLFLCSLIPYLPLRNVENTILATLRLVTPNDDFYASVSAVISDFLNTQHTDVLSFGVLLTLYFSSNGMMGLMGGFDDSLVLYKKRSGLQRRWTAIKLTIMQMLVGIIALAVLILQNTRINKYLLQVFPNLIAVEVLSYLILVLLIFITYCLIYTYGPSLQRRFPFISAGAVFATLASMATTYVFYYMVDNFLNYNKVYGSIGTLIAFMVLVWLNTLIVLLGFELNVSILLGKINHEHEAQS